MVFAFHPKPLAQKSKTAAEQTQPLQAAQNNPTHSFRIMLSLFENKDLGMRMRMVTLQPFKTLGNPCMRSHHSPTLRHKFPVISPHPRSTSVYTTVVQGRSRGSEKALGLTPGPVGATRWPLDGPAVCVLRQADKVTPQTLVAVPQAVQMTLVGRTLFLEMHLLIRAPPRAWCRGPQEDADPAFQGGCDNPF